MITDEQINEMFKWLEFYEKQVLQHRIKDFEKSITPGIPTHSEFDASVATNWQAKYRDELVNTLISEFKEGNTASVKEITKRVTELHNNLNHFADERLQPLLKQQRQLQPLNQPPPPPRKIRLMGGSEYWDGPMPPPQVDLLSYCLDRFNFYKDNPSLPIAPTPRTEIVPRKQAAGIQTWGAIAEQSMRQRSTQTASPAPGVEIESSSAISRETEGTARVPNRQSFCEKLMNAICCRRTRRR